MSETKELVTEALSDIAAYLPKLPSIIIVLGLGVFVIRFLQKAVVRLLRRLRLDDTLISFVNAFLTFACWVFLISIVFSILGFPQISVAFSGSIALILVGVASNANSMIQDLLAGIFLIADPDFKIGSYVKVNNIAGRVVKLDIKKTKIMDDEGNVHVISNKVFDSSVYTIETNGEHEE